mmetsp:Transcript_9670/g.12061  ORF Transcript_9670/g.12061 Transcript_9670/m.12061 type:complete len:89 (+) Transcript_9670:91-357(+)
MLRRSSIWMPMLKEAPSQAKLRSHQLLVRGGYFSQMASGIFSILPLGNRVLEKLEKVVDSEMQVVLGVCITYVVFSSKDQVAYSVECR